MDVPNCYKCKYREELTWSCHSKCNNKNAKVKGDPHGISNGWFMWPVNFDPVWLESCYGFEQK